MNRLGNEKLALSKNFLADTKLPKFRMLSAQNTCVMRGWSWAQAKSEVLLVVPIAVGLLVVKTIFSRGDELFAGGPASTRNTLLASWKKNLAPQINVQVFLDYLFVAFVFNLTHKKTNKK